MAETTPESTTTTVTTVRETNSDGDVVGETVTTTTVETIKKPDPPATGMYV